MEEIWKDIPGYEGYYQVSNMGRVKSLGRKVRQGVKKNGEPFYKTVRERICTLQNSWGNYSSLLFHKDGVVKCLLIHRLVAKMFVPNPNNLPEINHKDGNRKNARAENLEWCNRSYNIWHSYHVNGRVQSNSVTVKCIENGITYPSFHEAARSLGLDKTLVSKVARGRQPQTKGYHFTII